MHSPTGYYAVLRNEERDPWKLVLPVITIQRTTFVIARDGTLVTPGEYASMIGYKFDGVFSDWEIE